MTLDQVKAAVERIIGKRAARVAAYAGAVALCKAAGKKFVTVQSQTNPATFYCITATGGCQCPGYKQRGYCTHHDLAMTVIAARADTAAATAAAPASGDEQSDETYPAWLDAVDRAAQLERDMADIYGAADSAVAA
jgi:hypothetical protein